VHRGTRLGTTSESEVVLGIKFIDGPVAREGGGLVGQGLRHLVLDVQGRVDTTLALGGGNEALVSTLGVLALVDGEGVIARLGERVYLGTPAVSAVSPTRDRFAFLRNGLVEMSERRAPPCMLIL